MSVAVNLYSFKQIRISDHVLCSQDSCYVSMDFVVELITVIFSLCRMGQLTLSEVMQCLKEEFSTDKWSRESVKEILER